MFSIVSGSFRILARIHDGHEIIGEKKASYPIKDFVQKSNNVAMKDIIVPPSFGTLYFPESAFAPEREIISESDLKSSKQTKSTEKIAYGSIEIDMKSNDYDELLPEYAEVYLRLNPNLYKTWKENEGQTLDLKEKEINLFLMSSSKAAFKNINFQNISDSSYIQVEINYLSSEKPSDNKFEFDILLKSGEDIFHGNRVTSFRDPDRFFVVKARTKKQSLIP